MAGKRRWLTEELEHLECSAAASLYAAMLRASAGTQVAISNPISIECGTFPLLPPGSLLTYLQSSHNTISMISKPPRASRAVAGQGLGRWKWHFFCFGMTSGAMNTHYVS